MGSDIVWVEPLALKAKHCGIKAKKGDNVGAGHTFGGLAYGRKVCSYGLCQGTYFVGRGRGSAVQRPILGFFDQGRPLP